MHDEHACVYICEHCMQYICLELLMLADSESLPWGGQKENGESTRELWIARQKKRELNSQTEREGGGGDRQEMKGSKRNGWECLTSCTERAHSPCGLLMRSGGDWWAASHRPVRSAVLTLTLWHTGNSLTGSLISNTCENVDGHGRAVMNNQGWMIKHMLPVNFGYWLFGFSTVDCASHLFIQGRAIWEQVFFFNNSLFWKRKHKT